MKVLITGAGGQLGQDLVDAYQARPNTEVIAVAHDDLDVSNEAAVSAHVHRHEPALIINSAAWTNVDGCEQDPDRAHRVNALGPWWLARAADNVGATLVHLSTDYVFAGDATAPYSEFDPVAPVSEYGRSKAAGEALIRQTLSNHHIIRTAWVCGARGNNFVKTMLRVGREHGQARVVDDQVGSPTFTRDLATAIREVAASGRFGTWNRTNAGTCSWYELAEATFALAGMDVALTAMPSTELDRPAPRPAYSVLSDRHATAAGLRPLRPWREGLARLLEELGEMPSGGAA